MQIKMRYDRNVNKQDLKYNVIYTNRIEGWELSSRHTNIKDAGDEYAYPDKEDIVNVSTMALENTYTGLHISKKKLEWDTDGKELLGFSVL